MPSKPLISIAMTTYNGAKFLDQQLNSLLQQTYKNIEIIICDDSSSDGTRQMLEGCSDARVRVYSNKKNLGYIKNFERACGLCNGEFIALCDQDDIWLPNKLETLEKELNANPSASAIFSNASLIDKNGTELGETLWDHTYSSLKLESAPKELFYYFNVVTGCTMMIRRTIVEAAMPFPTNAPHDHWLAYCCSTNGDLLQTNTPLIKYRLHDGNTIGINKIAKKNARKGLTLSKRIQARLAKLKRKHRFGLKLKQFSEKLEKRKSWLDYLKAYELDLHGKYPPELEIISSHTDRKLASNKLNVPLGTNDKDLQSKISQFEPLKRPEETVRGLKIRLIKRAALLYGTYFTLVVIILSITVPPLVDFFNRFNH